VIDQRLRVRLGEALTQVSQTSRPLEQVTTANLDALRAYSLGQRAYFTGNMKDALSFYNDAVRLDPQFATAHLVIARVLLNANQNSEALKQIELAAATPNRLSARDSLLVDAWHRTLTAPGTSLQKWKSLTTLYPDFYPANGPYSYYAWCANEYEAAINAAKFNIAPQNANRGAGLYLLGILYLGNENYIDSLKEFQLAADSGIGRNDFYAQLYSSQRRFQQANVLLQESKPSGLAADDEGTELVRIALAADQGRWGDAKLALANAERLAEPIGILNQQRVRGIELGLRSEFDKVEAPELTRYAQAGLSQQIDNALDEEHVQFRALFAMWLLARDGNGKAARDLLDKMKHDSSEISNPVLKNMLTIVTAELERGDGHAGQAIELLQPLVNGSELYVTHLALLDSFASNHENARAMEEARWLATHRGRAYAEYGFAQFMTAFNVVQSDLALLRTAELAFDLKDVTKAKESLAEFDKIWPRASSISGIDRRLSSLRKNLE
jgi:hypothetical protein